jgi:mono/diheme cytochrome c family protein
MPHLPRPKRVQRAGALLLLLSAGAPTLSAQLPDDFDALSGRELYDAACANCHGSDGRGLDRAQVGFEEPLPDFTDCEFAPREPDSDWIAVTHDGGPARAFSEMMPAFEGALTLEQIGRILRHVRSLCTDPAWPRGELNLPRALVTEKAFPEDEWVVEVGVDLEGAGAADGQFVYERRFGARSMFEVVIPYGWAAVPDAGGPAGATRWVSGFGDVVLGLKHAAHHSVSSGTILALGAEIVLPTGDEAKGFGNDGTKTEAFVSLGQILPADAFLQVQVGAEVPLYESAANEGFGRLALGRTFTSGRWGRAWTPMLELLAKRDLESGAPTALDLVPQIQVSLSTRQHVLFNVGVLVPTTETAGRPVRLLAYMLLDWFDGGFFEGW